MKQLVKKPTRKNKILSVLITDLHRYYHEPTIISPIEPDEAGKGKPSDHSTPIAYPYLDTSKPRNLRKLVSVRPLPESGMRRFGQWITKETCT